MSEYFGRLQALKHIVASEFQASRNEKNEDLQNFDTDYDCNSLVKRVYQSLIPEQTIGSDSSITDSVVDISADLEIVFRDILAGLLSNTLFDLKLPHDIYEEKDQCLDPNLISCVHLVRFTTDFALSLLSYCDSAGAFAKVPFLLIDDLLEEQTIQNGKLLWKIIEGMIEKLVHPSLFPKGKFIVLKTCNSLLRKLSKTCDTEFCGSILMFLAAVYPISERSAVNLSGKVNVSNVTYFDEESEFLSSTSKQTSTSELLQITKPTSPQNTQEDGEVKANGDSGTTTSNSSVTFEIYRSFWQFQTILSADFKAFDSPQAPQTTSVTKLWSEFMSHAKRVFEIFDTCEDVSSSISSQGYSGCKYLTSSQLFVLQLRDPQLRQQIAIQILMFCHYLKSKAIQVLDHVENRVSYLKDISQMHQSCAKLISLTPGSSELKRTVQKVLERECNWISWKTDSCPPFEKSLPEDASKKRKFSEADNSENADGSAVEADKPKPTAASLQASRQLAAMNRIAAAGNNAKSYTFDVSEASIQQLAKKMVASRPDFEEQIQLYLDADDPEAGIDEEYHPKHDHLYCWRTRRLLAVQDIAVFSSMADGDLGKGLRRLKNIPEPAPKEVPEADERENQESVVAEDIEMDIAVSDKDLSKEVGEDCEGDSSGEAIPETVPAESVKGIEGITMIVREGQEEGEEILLELDF